LGLRGGEGQDVVIIDNHRAGRKKIEHLLAG